MKPQLNPNNKDKNFNQNNGNLNNVKRNDKKKQSINSVTVVLKIINILNENELR